MRNEDIECINKLAERMCKEMQEHEVRVIAEKPLSDSKKADLVVAILNLLLKEELSLNQIQGLLQMVQNEACKVTITGFYSKNDHGLQW